MAFLGLRIPQTVGKTLLDYDLPEKKEGLLELHVTILRLGKNLPVTTYLKALEAVHEIYKDIEPFTISTQEIITFPVDNDDPYPIVAKVDSDSLNELYKKISKYFDERGIIHCKKYEEFIPHITLSYARTIIPNFGISKIEIPLNELLLWGGICSNSRILNTFPLCNAHEEDVNKQVAQTINKLCENLNGYLTPTSERRINERFV